MDASFFIRGLFIGLSIAAAVGPISILCIQRTLERGQLYGLVSGLGAATADAFYGSIAAFGLTIISTFLLNQQLWIHLLGGIFLLYLGIKTLRTRPAERAAVARAQNYPGAYLSTLLLTLTNPTTILSFIAIFAGIGVGGASKSYLAAAIVVGGVFLGSALWWVILTSGVSLLRKKFTPRWLLWINRCSGIVITLFGIFALLSLL
ncbi:MAG: LysE family transporter [Ktedonobacteraceae bacterium]|nr:LysE family transporter [Ktedonobacteraceae bacterium]